MELHRHLLILVATSTFAALALAAPGAPIPAGSLTGAGAKTSSSTFGSKLAKALTPKPASYHGNKAAAHAGAGAARSIESAYSLVAHPIKGVIGGGKAGFKTLKSTVTLKPVSAGENLAKTVGKPVTGVVGGAYLGAKAGGLAAADIGRAAYHGVAYPVSKLHEAVRGKPKPAVRNKYATKFAQWSDNRLYKEGKRLDDHATLDFLTLGRLKKSKEVSRPAFYSHSYSP